MAGHIEPVRNYVLVLIALLILTVATVYAAFIDMGVLNEVVGLGIATTKAILVAMFFMHLRHSVGLTKIIAASGAFWLAVLILLAMSDYATRGMLGVPGH
ncbi:MAG: caa(3)-type oxidase subunit IV [Candidatus Dadabacteria bacterium]|nr:MAG: caa(3)-type oxidase subunit IV [Candidatus Dadabacteria bacterium]